jgi:hypothetical protein
MKLAFIAPTNSLNKISDKGDILFCLAPCCLEDKKYKEYFKYTYKYVIMDNGAAEGDTINNDEYVRLAIEMEVDEIIVPDVIGNMQETIEKLYFFIEKYGWLLHQKEIKLHAVIQGKNYEEYKIMYDLLLSEPSIDVIGIPFRMNFNGLKFNTEQDRAINRLLFLDNIEVIQKPIHCLGSNNIFEIYELNKRPFVRSCDSKLIARYGKNLQLINKYDQYKPKEKIEMNDKLTFKQRRYTLKNINKLRKILK